MPKISDIQETPNPNAVKFILREPVTHGIARSFKTSDEAFEDKLARELFEVGDVASVFYMDYMITVEKSDYAVWDELLPLLAVPIRAAEAANGNGKEKGADKSPAEAVGGAIAAALSDDPRLAQINELLDQRIRPALAGDGGWVDVMSLTDNVLTLRYQGACGTCPSSLTGTLMAIEGMIHEQVDPEIEVIAV
jgi:Fe-S cluster biogenesis protein NfuA